MMIVRFGLDWDAMAAPGQRTHQMDATCRRIVDFWTTFGVLVVCGGDQGKRDFLASIDELPQSTRKLWKSALKRLHRRIVFSAQLAVAELLDPADLRHLVGEVDLVGAEDDRCSILGLMESDLCILFPHYEIEVARLHCIDQADCIARARRLACADIARDAPAEEVWNQRIAPLLPWSRHFVVVDRYCGVDVLRRAPSTDSGLEFVLRRVWNANIPVIVYMANPRHQPEVDFPATLASFSDAVATMVDRLNAQCGLRADALEIHRVPDAEFGALSHDRYLRCDSWVVKLDVGLEPFAGGNSRRERTLCELTFGAAANLKSRFETERRLREVASGTYVRCADREVRAETSGGSGLI